MNSFPEDIVDVSLGINLYVQDCCRKERFRLTAIIRGFIRDVQKHIAKFGCDGIKNILCFAIQCDCSNSFVPASMKSLVSTSVQRILSGELKQRYSQLEYCTDDSNNNTDWEYVPEEGCSALKYRIAFCIECTWDDE